MSVINLPSVRQGKTTEEMVNNLFDSYFMLRKELTFLLQNLDAENVVEAKSVVADWVYAGNIKANQIDVTEGKIQAAQIEDLIVGSNVIMGPNARISWSQVTNQPDIGQIALDKINATYIDANGVWTPNVYATNISTLNGKITTAQIEDLIVGGNVTMGPNATISWSQVTSKPDIPVLPSYIQPDRIVSTYIDSSTIQSPTIVGGAIIGGTIISNTTINVGTDARVGKNLYLGAQGDNTPKTIYFNEFTYIKGSTGIVGTDIEIGCHEVFFDGFLDGNISFIGSMNFSNSSVSGLENSGYYKLDYIQNWVTQNFVHK